MRQIAQRIGVVFSTVIVVFVGFSTFLGLLLGDVSYNLPETAYGFAIPFFGGASGVLSTDGLALIFVRIAVVTIALTIVIGVINLLAVNSRRVIQGKLTAKLSSIIIIVMFFVTLVIYAARPTIDEQDGFQFLLENVQVPIESALTGLIFFALVYGAFRLLRKRVTLMGLLFVLTVEIVLIGALPLPGIELLTSVTDWLMRVPVTAGTRGILLGIALATLVTGLRVLIGQDRTYGE
ncbi:MAG: hypothetical protein Q9P01_04180 [Anaerolineae bacterium]|nr:hypothetical protein [Anaerolineae bacterium]MDQ7034041.1 hypothetical protein [Anaerolineae bacterium]